MKRFSDAAHAAAHGASRHKASSLSLSSRVCDLLKGLSLTDTASNQPRLSPLSRANVEDAYDQLIAEFAPCDAQAALLAVAGFSPSAASSSSSSSPSWSSSSSVDALVDAALDWLCLNLDTNSLPRRYAGALPDNAGAASQGGEGSASKVKRRQVKVLAKEEERKIDKDSEAAAARKRAEEAAALRAEQEAAAAVAAKAAAEAAAREREEERDASKSYILKYLEQEGDDGSDDNDEDGTISDDDGRRDPSKDPPPDSPRSTSSSIIEDWEVWGDPREIERRKLERARTARPREERVEQVVGEWGVVRAEAARAKACGDRDRQRTAGMAMASLRREAEELGIGQDELEGRKPGGEEKKGSGGGGSGGDDDDDSRSTSSPSSSSSSSSDDGAGMGLFDDEADADAPQWEAPSAASRKPLNVEDILRPWGEAAAAATAAEGAKKKGGGGGGKQAPNKVAAVSSLAPKAVLQQLCTKKGIPPPRFDKLPPGGHRGEALADAAADVVTTAGLLRYSVAVEPFSSSSPSSAAAAKRGGGAKRRPPPPVVFTLEESEDGWSTIQEAQNAAATLALYRLTGCGGGGEARSGVGARQRKRAPPTSVAAASREVMSAEGASALASLDAKSPYAALFLSWVARDSGLLTTVEQTGAAPEDDDNSGGAAAAAISTSTSAETDRAHFIRSVVAARTAAIAAFRKKAMENAAGDRDDETEEEDEAASGSRQNCQQRQRRQPLSSSSSSSELESHRMLRDLEAFDSSTEGQDWARKRSLLPVFEIRQPLLQALSHSDVVVVGGDTGCGKTTQVPQYLLEAATRELRGGDTSIVCTQPRRLAAVSVAERVSQERGEHGGPGAKGTRVGYHVRLDASYTKETKLLFCTTGILLRKLGGDGAGGGSRGGEAGAEEEEASSSSSLDLCGVSHVIVDEVHERSLQGDFLLTILRDVVARRRRAYGEALAEGNNECPPPPLKVVLMSATLDSRLFASYFGSNTPCLRAGGRTFPVEHLFLEDVYARIRYRLASDSRAALRLDAKAARKRQQELATRVSASQARLARDNWGDADADALEAAGALNKWYDAELYRDRDEFVRRNLERVDETAIDFDLIEELVDYIDATDDNDNEKEEKQGESERGPASSSSSASKAPIGTGGAVLIFLPGAAEIAAVCSRLSASEAARRGKRWVLPLHSSVSPADQRRVFQRPPRGVRKCVVATNIAETSITIDDVSFVIDSGKLKERRHDASRGMGLLVEDFVSRASALQRKGRAGRTRPGVCFALYTRRRFGGGGGGRGGERNGGGGKNDDGNDNTSSSSLPTTSSNVSGGVLRAFQVPEMIRVPLEELVLQIHLLGLGPAGPFLSRVLEPPPARAVEAALESLRSVGALEPLPERRGDDNDDEEEMDENEASGIQPERLTPLGRHLAQLPVDARVGKLLLMGALLGVLSPALTIAACLSHKPPFLAEGPLGGGGGGSGARDQQPGSAAADNATVSAVKAALGAMRGSSSAAAAMLLTPAAGGKGQKPALLSAASVPSIAAGQQSDHLVWAAAYEAWSSAKASARANVASAGENSGGVSGGGSKGRANSSADASRAARAAGAAVASRLALSQQCLDTLRDMRGQFATMLADARFVDPRSSATTTGSGSGGGNEKFSPSAAAAAWADDHEAPYNRHAREACVIKAALTAALYPNVAVLDDAGGGEKGGGGGGGGGGSGATAATMSFSSSSRPLFHDGSGPVSIHPSSTLSSVPARALTSPYLVYLEKVRTTKAFLRDATAVSPMAVCLFGGSGRLEARHAERSLIVDGWLKARLPSAAAAVLVVRAREALDRYLESRVSGGRGGRGGNSENEKSEKNVIDAVVWLLREHAAVATAAKD